MGRRKIAIELIKDDRYRLVTFAKRKQGLFKKAHELSVLCGCEVGVIIFGQNGRLSQFSSGGMDNLLLRYAQNTDTPSESKTNTDLCSAYNTDLEQRRLQPRKDRILDLGTDIPFLELPDDHLQSTFGFSDDIIEDEDIEGTLGSVFGKGFS